MFLWDGFRASLGLRRLAPLGNLGIDQGVEGGARGRDGLIVRRSCRGAFRLLPSQRRSRHATRDSTWHASGAFEVTKQATWLLPLIATAAFSPASADGQDVPDHAAFTEILAEVVQAPMVDYEALKLRQVDFDGYLEQLSNTDLAALERASRGVRLAFWINAYNACMLQRVAVHYPIQKNAGFLGSIRNAITDRPENSVWQIRDVFTESFCPVAGASRSLDEIEHEIIRPLGEPRIHFVVNCAARSCPPLAPEAYVADRLDEQLDRAVLGLISNPEHFRIDREGAGVVTLNRVLDWYGDDFGGKEGLLRFLADYVAPADAELLGSADVEVRFFEYDWTLNDIGR